MLSLSFMSLECAQFTLSESDVHSLRIVYFKQLRQVCLTQCNDKKSSHYYIIFQK